AQAAGLAVVSATPNGPNAPISAQIRITFNQPINPATFSGSINGAPLVPTEIVVNPGNTVVDVDPGVLEYARTYTVTVNPTLGAPFPSPFAVATGPPSKRPPSTVTLPGGPLQPGQSYTISGQASGYVWQRDAGNPLELQRWDLNGQPSGARPMLHPTALYFPN